MKKVTLLGDSIRMIGYGKTVAEALNKDGIEVFQPEENCRFSKYRVYYHRQMVSRTAEYSEYSSL